MNSKKSWFAALLLNVFIICITGFLHASDQKGSIDIRKLEEGFQNPPQSARPGAFWPWLQGNVDLPQITRELEEMKEKGMSGAEIWDVGAVHNENSFIPSGPAFLSSASVDAMHHAIKEGTRLGLRMGMVTSSGWNAGGAWVRPKDASKALYFSQLTVKGPLFFSQVLPFPQIPEKCPKGRDGMPQNYKDIAVLAFPKTNEKVINDISSIVNLTEVLEKSGRLTWYVPEGEWIIMRFVCTNTGQMMIIPSPNSNGYFIDFLDPEATKMHMEYIIGKLLEKLGSFKETAFSYLEVDSMELQEGNPWTDNFLQEFINRRGYDPTFYLPVLAGWSVNDKDISTRFMYDYKKTISDLLIFSHYTTGSKVLEKYGLELVAEAGGPGPPVWDTCPVDALKALGQVHVPRGEFWIRHRNLFLIKEVSSAAHIYGKKYVDAESFTTWRRWMDSPFELKKIADRALCEGLNRFTFHTFSHTPPEFGLPGTAYHAGVDINTNATWWQKAKPFINYLARCSYMLQQGLFIGDVCYYYGDKAPNFYPLYHDVPEKIIRPDLGQGYDYDVTNTEVILSRMNVKDGRIILPDGMNYELLVLPDQDDMPLEVLQKLEQLVKDGATIVGQKPVRSNGLANHPAQSERVKELADKIWGACDGKAVKENTYGKGMIVWGYNAREILQRRNIVPDFIYPNPDGKTDLDYIHRKTENEDIYFVRNKSDRWEEVQCFFRVTNRKPELWVPETGEVQKDIIYNSTEGGTNVKLQLPPGGSVFVLFCDPLHENRVSSFTKIGSEFPATEIHSSQEVNGSWEVTFPPGWGAPVKKVFPYLISWTDDEEEGIKYFSGTATYRKEIEISSDLLGIDTKLFLDLGKVGEVADVFLNGKHLGILWKPPYQIEITGTARQGKNELIIEITNLWVNRLTGDLLLPVNKRFCKTNQKPYTSDAGEGRMYKVLPSGLMGPVKLVPVKNAAARISGEEKNEDLSLHAPIVITSTGPEYADEKRLWQGIPGIERALNGRLWILWYSGGKTEEPGNYVIAVTSGDDGKTWSGPKLVIQPADKEVRAFDPCLWHDPLGRLWLFWAQSFSFMDGRVGVWAIQCDNSSSDNPDWSQPRRLCDGIMMNKLVVLRTGEWLLPAALWDREPKRPELASIRKANVICSMDSGKTWLYRGGTDAAGRSIDEPMIVERLDGTLWMLIRMPYGIAESVSKDGGKTWTQGIKSSIPGPDSRFFIRRLKSGRLLLVNHHNFLREDQKPVRKNLTAFLSEDDGRTWIGGLLLDEREGVSYPDAIEADDGRIFLVYDYSRYKEREILLAVFREEDILKKSFVSKDARSKCLVNKAGQK